jgi:hypothetical protein
MASRDGSEEKQAEQEAMTMDARKAKMEELRAKMVRSPSQLRTLYIVHSATAFIDESEPRFPH